MYLGLKFINDDALSFFLIISFYIEKSNRYQIIKVETVNVCEILSILVVNICD